MTGKFIFITVCLGVAVLSYFFTHSKKDWGFLVGGLASTALADYFLVLHDNHLPGVAVFCFAHIFYILRVYKKPQAKYLAASVGAIIFAFYTREALFSLGATYAILFIFSIVVNIKSTQLPRANKAIVLTGLILFALCDINVLLFNLPRQFGVGSFPWAFTLIWVFYLPAQALLAISSIAWSKPKE